MTYPNDPVPTFQDSPSMATPLDSSNLNEDSVAIEQIQAFLPSLQLYIPFTAVQGASSISIAANTYALVSTASNNVTANFPVAPPNFTVVGIKQVVRGGTNTVSMQLGGSDHFDTTTGSQTGTITLLNQSGLWQYNSATAVWVKVSDNLSLSQLDSRYTAAGTAVTSVTAGDSSITMAGTSTAPTVKVAQSALTLTQSQITGLSTALNPAYSAGSAWGPNVYSTQVENTERDDIASTYLIVSGDRTVLVLLGLCPASTYSSFKFYITNTPSGGTMTAALFSSSTLTGTSWSRLGSGNVTPTLAAGLVSTSLSFTLSSPAYVVLQMVMTATATTYPSLAATTAGAVPTALIQPASGCPVSAIGTGTSAPGTTLNPTTGFSNLTQKIWCALA